MLADGAQAWTDGASGALRTLQSAPCARCDVQPFDTLALPLATPDERDIRERASCGSAFGPTTVAVGAEAHHVATERGSCRSAFWPTTVAVSG
jgi:hypothetical protein